LSFCNRRPVPLSSSFLLEFSLLNSIHQIPPASVAVGVCLAFMAGL
jgi:hypothetical protein